jgi:hypothetical protein
MNSIKKLLLNQGGWRTVEGEPPLTLSQSKGEELKDYKLYGNTLQNESVGDKTSNIADLSKASVSTSTPHVTYTYDNMTGTLELTSKPQQYDYAMISAEKLGLENGKTYCFGGDITVSGKTTSNVTITVLSLFGTGYTDFRFTSDGTKHVEGTFAYTGQASVNLRLYFNYGSAEPAYCRFDNVYVSEVKNEFEPCCYKIPITANNGTEEKTTNIYLAEPLRKVDEYVDYIDYENGKLVRWVESQQIEVSINLPPIPTTKGRTILDSDTSVKLSKIKVTYKKG